MKTMTRVSVSLLFLIAAIACYTFGAHAGGTVFLVIGVIFEGLFWVGLFGRKKSPKVSR